jgi:hypothetical protein
MHRIESRTYVGQPSEIVTLTTQVDGGGQVSVVVDGQDIGAARQFPLPTAPGTRLKWQITLMGPQGATCVVGIATVDGASDGDFLMCQAHNPAPVNFYTSSVAAAPALEALATARRARARKAPAKGRKKRAKSSKPTRKGRGK